MFNLKLNKKLLLLIAVCSLAVLATSLLSELSLGDEAFHYRFAENIFKAGRRVAFDPLYGTGRGPGYFYNNEPFWHVVLALIWKILGKVSFPAAQFYHTIYYSLLIFFTYLLGKELYGKREAFYAALIIATIPAILVFSVVFYLDVPAVCFSTLCILLVVKKRFLWSGLVLVFMYFTKRNALFFAPVFILFIFFAKGSRLRDKIKNLLYLFAPSFLLVPPDLFWREKNLKYTMTFVLDGKQYSNANLGSTIGIIDRLSLKWWKFKTQEYLNSSLFNPVDVLKYFGIALLMGLAIYFLFKIYRKKDIRCWALILCYFLFFSLVFTPGSDIRYLLPVFPLLAILSSVAIANFSYKKWFKLIVIVLCSLQFCGTIFFMSQKRVISKEIKEGFAYLRDNTPADTFILYPENIIINETNRRFLWLGNCISLYLDDYFWETDEDKAMDFLKKNKIGYIAVKKTRIYDDSKRHHYGGYPKSFVDRLPEMPFLNPVFDNKEISIWQVK